MPLLRSYLRNRVRRVRCSIRLSLQILVAAELVRLIAILLGRLRLTVNEAIYRYRALYVETSSHHVYRVLRTLSPSRKPHRDDSRDKAFKKFYREEDVMNQESVGSSVGSMKAEEAQCQM